MMLTLTACLLAVNSCAVDMSPTCFADLQVARQVVISLVVSNVSWRIFISF